MKETLELKHLAPYLPYGLKLFYTHTKKVGQISNIYTLGEGYDEHDLKISIDGMDAEHIWMFKPILRPLSELASFLDKSLFVEQWHDEWINHFADFQDKPSEANMLSCPYDLFDFLISHHFDMYNLIPKNLATPKQ